MLILSRSRQIISKRDKIVGGRFRLSTIDFEGLYFDSIGLADARIEVRAFSDVIIPALAMDTVCCSITSCKIVRVLSDILSNSSIQQMPPSDSTSAPLKNKTKFQLPFQNHLTRFVVSDDIGSETDSGWPFSGRVNSTRCQFVHILQKLDAICCTCKSCDLLTPGSPASKMLISPLKRLVADLRRVLPTPPNNWSNKLFLTFSNFQTLGAKS